jgi:hypothetical protein
MPKKLKSLENGHSKSCMCRECVRLIEMRSKVAIIERTLYSFDPKWKLANMETIPWAGEDEAEKEKKD